MGTPVPATQILIAILPIVSVVLGTTLIFFFLLWRHKEIMCQIQTGIYKPSNFNISAFALLTGVLLTAVGFVLSLIFIKLDGIGYILLGGLIPFSLGIGLLVYYKICTYRK